jgi:hypothetical protein
MRSNRFSVAIVTVEVNSQRNWCARASPSERLQTHSGQVLPILYDSPFLSKFR